MKDDRLRVLALRDAMKGHRRGIADLCGGGEGGSGAPFRSPMGPKRLNKALRLTDELGL